MYCIYTLPRPDCFRPPRERFRDRRLSEYLPYVPKNFFDTYIEKKRRSLSLDIGATWCSRSFAFLLAVVERHTNRVRRRALAVLERHCPMLARGSCSARSSPLSSGRRILPCWWICRRFWAASPMTTRPSGTWLFARDGCSLLDTVNCR